MISEVQNSYRRGFALVAVLMILAMTVIFVVALTMMMRTERVVAHNMFNTARADLLAQSAIANAVSVLATNIPDPIDPTIEPAPGSGVNWFINPGQLTLIRGAALPDKIPLYSGPPAQLADITEAVNLNAPGPSTGKFPITGKNDPMWISWINVLPDANRPAAADNRLIGRYAFWIDDECSKININTARGKPSDIKVALPPDWSNSSTSRDLWPYLTPTFTIASGGTSYALGHPASVNLNSLGGGASVNVQKLEEDVAGKGFRSNSDAIRDYFNDQANREALYEAQKFNLTAFSRTPEFNVFGKPRLFMARSVEDLETSCVYQNLPHPNQPTLFFGHYLGTTRDRADLTRARVLRNKVVETLTDYLERDDWPGFVGRRFRWTGGTDGTQESEQIAIDLASMGFMATTETGGNGEGLANYLKRCNHSGGGFTEPGNSRMWAGPLTGKAMVHNQAAPFINECGIRLVPERVSGTQFRLRVDIPLEFYIPPGYFRDNSTLQFTNPAVTAEETLMLYVPYLEVAVQGTTSRTNIMKDGSSARVRYNVPTVALDDYTQMIASNWYIASGTELKSVGSALNLSKTGIYTVRVKMRIGIAHRNADNLYTEVAPIFTPQAQLQSGTVSAGARAASEDDATFDFTFTLNTALPDLDFYSSTNPAFCNTFECDDPRVWREKRFWKRAVAATPTDPRHTMGDPNSASTSDPSRISKAAMWNFSLPVSSPKPGAPSSDRFREWLVPPNFRGASIGQFSFVSTGLIRGKPWETLQFHNYGPPNTEVPDWAIMDLLAPTFPSPLSLRNSTAGKINLNSKIYPTPAQSPVFRPPVRKEPLAALFRHMPNGDSAADRITQYQEDGGVFDYLGRICEVPGLADGSLSAQPNPTDFEKEVLVRNLASLMTTQSNTFGIWGVAQTVRKRPGGRENGKFEPGDTVTGERRFYAVVERYVWEGKDGAPGNGEVDTSGIYAKTANAVEVTTTKRPGSRPAVPASGSSLDASWANKVWAALDGPHDPQWYTSLGQAPYTKTSLASASNPIAPAMKYRIVYFRYVD